MIDSFLAEVMISNGMIFFVMVDIGNMESEARKFAYHMDARLAQTLMRTPLDPKLQASDMTPHLHK